MDGKARVFIVDDDVILLDVLSGALEDEFFCHTFLSAEACLAQMPDVLPDIFLLDLTLPGMSGVELCQHLKSDPLTQKIPVAVVSSSDDMNVRLKCYEVGAEDFLLKPVQTAELLRRVRTAVGHCAEKRSLYEEAGYAQRTAMSAMVSMGELGVVLQFLSRSFSCNSPDELAHALLNAVQEYGLSPAVQLRMKDFSLSVSPMGVNLPLEVSVLNHVRDSGRIFQFKTRCVFNYGLVTLLINNMPLADPDRCGRIRDNLALLAEGANARLQAIETEQVANFRRLGIETALPRVRATLDSVQANYRRNSLELTEVMIEFHEALGKAFMTLGLTADQETSLADLANDYMQRMVASQDASLRTIGELRELAIGLEDVLRR